LVVIADQKLKFEKGQSKPKKKIEEFFEKSKMKKHYLK